VRRPLIDGVPVAELLAGAASWSNAVSLLRVPLAFVFFATESVAVRVVVIVLAAASDWVDGWLARRFRQGSRAGELIDPLTDKFFLVSAIIAFAADGMLAPWELAILLARDALTVAAFLLASALQRTVRFRARFSGKVVTTLQLAAVLVLTVVPVAGTVVVLLAGAATIWAVADYGAYFVRSLRRARAAG
jgi:CDP-diacylglycerol--glycerol-3-phosphate 3-phosphatidyltransferase